MNQNLVVFVARRVAATLTLVLLALCCVPAAFASATCSEASFRLAQSFDMSSRPHTFVAADLNGDGRPDIAATGVNGVEVRLNDGSGWFGVPVRFFTGSFPTGIDAGDFNGDGRTDLIVGGSERSDVSLLLGNGSGGFAAPINFTAGERTISVLAADFNGDGKTDVAVGYLGTGSSTGFVSVLLGDGAGNLSRAGASSINSFPGSFVSADFNRDGKLDLALTGNQNALLLPGDGAGGFAPPLSILTGEVRNLAAGDLNGDGNPDLAAADGNNGLSLLFGDGTGGFSAPLLAPTGPMSIPADVTAADFDGDGKLDLAAILSGGTSLAVLRGDGAGGFGPPRPFSAGRVPIQLVAADFNADGASDLAVSKDIGGSFTEVPGFVILLGDGAGGFNAPPEIVFSEATRTGPLAAADFNRDGKPDLAVVILSNTLGLNNTVAIYFGDGAGGFAVHTYVPASAPTDVETADLNNDSNPDLVVKQESGFIALLGDGAGNFSLRMGPGGLPSSGDIAVGDINDDGKADVAVTDFVNGEIQLTIGAGDGTFSPFSHVVVGAGPRAVTLADFNGDGVQDIATARAPTLNSGVVTVLLGQGTGLFSAPNSYEIKEEPRFLVSGDFNGDGKADLFTADLFATSISVLNGNGDGTFRPRATLLLNAAASHMAAHDFNADGKPDLAVSQRNTNTVALLYNNLTTPLPCVSVADATFNEGSSGESEGEFTVTLSDASDKTVRVSYSFAGFPATVNQDFRNVPGSVTFAPGTTSQKIKVPIIGDIIDEETESFLVILRAPSNALLTDDEALGNILDDDPVPSISVGDALVVEGNSFANTLSFNVTLSTPSSKPITVQYSTSPGTANETTPGDYVAASGTLHFAPEQATQTVNVSVRADNVHESHETLFLHLSSPTNATIGNGTAQGVIVNDDPVPTLSRLGGSTTESPAGSLVTVRVTMSNPSDRAVTVSYATADDTATAGSDYVATSGTLTFNPGELEKAFTVAVIDDTLDEVAERFNVILSNPVNATVADESILYTIFDNDGPTVSINDVTVVEGNGGRTLATFTISLSAPTVQAVLLSVSTADGTATGTNTPQGDYARLVNSFAVILTGSTTTTVTVAVNGDQRIESDETFFVNLSEPSGATLGDAQGLGTITNDDTTSVRFSTNAVTANEADGSVQLTVERVGELSGGFDATYTTLDGSASERSDYHTAFSPLHFEPNETTKTVTIFLVNDSRVEGAENFTVLLSGANGGATESPSSVTVTINSDDNAPGPNPIDETPFFVRQHYRDFLGREPDPDGLAFWTNEIEQCGTDTQCREVKRINVSAAFFLSIEFQETGFYAVRVNRVAFGRRSDNAASRTNYYQLIHDQRRIGEGIVVGQPGYEQELEARKNAYVALFVAQPTFAARFPQTTADAYVDALYDSAGVKPTLNERQEAIDAYTSLGGNTAGRGAALRRVADSSSVRSAELNPAFVLLQYHGYLRRSPTGAPDFTDIGYQFWLTKLNQFGGNYIEAEMVKAFISSDEYRKRFGQ